MSTIDPSGRGRDLSQSASGSASQSRGKRLFTETKSFLKTSEFWVFLIVALAILIAADNIGGGRAGDYFNAKSAWLYVTILTVGYLLSRGLAKSGTHDPYWDRPASGGDGAPLTERVRAAAQALTGDEPSSRS
ncbi:MAG: hypothetical protein ACR2ND_09600 [Solirubrobacteraceae bacterium]